MCVCVSQQRPEEGVRFPLAAVRGCLIMVGGMELGSSARAARARPLSCLSSLYLSFERSFWQHGPRKYERGYVGDGLDCREREMMVAWPQSTIVMWRSGWTLQTFMKEERYDLVAKLDVGSKGKEMMISSSAGKVATKSEGRACWVRNHWLSSEMS